MEMAEEEKRKQRERRKEVRREADACALCDHYREQEKEHRENFLKELETKADGKELKGLAKLIATLVGVCVVVVSGTLVWLKMDIREMNVHSTAAISEAKASIIQTDNNIREGFANVNRRITDNNNERIKNDDTLIWQLGQIQGAVGTIEWRLKQIEGQIPTKK
jgi:translation initiation factor 2B subunit (eIF-2B alpha/beta/delta family)